MKVALKRLIVSLALISALLIPASVFSAATALQIDALWSGLNDPDTGQSYSGARVAFFEAGTTTPKAVWLDKDKTLPTVAGLAQTTLDSNGVVHVYGDGFYKINVYAPTDTGLLTPLSGSIDGVEYVSLYAEDLSSSVASIAALRAIAGTPTDGQIVNVLGYYASTENQPWRFKWSDSDLSSEIAEEVAAGSKWGRYVPLDGTNGSTGAFERLRNGNTIYVDEFGAKGDFVPSTGAGTDDGGSIRALFLYLRTLSNGANVIFTPGKKYLIGGFTAAADYGAIDASTASLFFSELENVNIIAYGSSIYHSNPGGINGGLFQYKGSKHCKWMGGALYGYTSRDGTNPGIGNEENIFGISIAQLSDDIVIQDTYITNFLGECIVPAGAWPGASLTGQTSTNIKIINNTLKERYGNGVRSSGSLSGTGSRNAIAIIDNKNVLISGNTIYGRIDIEPNTAGQYIENIKTSNNIFESGYVTPQATTGTDYWHDEPLGNEGDAGAVELEQDFSVAGAASGPLIKNVVFSNNVADLCNINFGAGNTYEAIIMGNSFHKGQIRLGSLSGGNANRRLNVKGNTCKNPIVGETSFIKLIGEITESDISNNSCIIASGYCVQDNGASSGDAGANNFSNNVNLSLTALGGMSSPYSPTSNVSGNWSTAPIVTNNIALLGGGTQTLNFTDILNGYNSEVVPLILSVDATGGNSDVTQIQNVPNGRMINITAITSGADTITLKYNASYLRLTGSVDKVLQRGSAVQSCRLLSVSGILYEQ